MHSQFFFLQHTEKELTKINHKNGILSEKLNERNLQVATLENELATTKSKLEKESKLRISSELAQDDAESNSRKVEATMKSMERDLENVHEKLAFSEAEVEELVADADIKRQENENLRDLLGKQMNETKTRAEIAAAKVLKLELLLLEKKERIDRLEVEKLEEYQNTNKRKRVKRERDPNIMKRLRPRKGKKWFNFRLTKAKF